MTKAIDSLDRLWASTVDRCYLDLATQRLRFDLTLVDSVTGSASHVLEFTEVSDMRFVNSIPSPWNYAEATEIRATVSNDEVVATMIFWSEDAQLRVTCKSVQLDGRRVAGVAAA